MEERKWYKTVLRVTVLSEDEPVPGGTGLEEIAREIDDGLWVGEVERESIEDLGRDRIVPELRKIGSDESFYDLTPEGQDAWEEEDE
jgi:hypothetical protein